LVHTAGVQNAESWLANHQGHDEPPNNQMQLTSGAARAMVAARS
jgi:hypothetical protein